MDRGRRTERDVEQALREMVAGQDLSELERARVQRQQRLIREVMRTYLNGSGPDFLAGEYSRGTSIRPLMVDLFMGLDGLGRGIIHARGRQRPMDRVYDTLRKVPGAQVPPLWPMRHHGPVVEFPDLALGFSVVPVFSDGPQQYIFPWRGGRKWYRTRPAALAAHLQQAQARSGGLAVPVVQVIKAWNRRNDRLLGSLHIELMALESVLRPGRLDEAVALAFAYLAERVQRRMPEPGGVGPSVDRDLTTEERGDLAIYLRDAGEQAVRALEFAARGRVQEAHYVWRDLLGEVYPEPGVEPKTRWF